jgi:hypothetical protein
LIHTAVFFAWLSPTFLLAKNFRSMMYSGISDITATVTCHGYWRMALMISLNSMISPFFASYQEAVLNTFRVSFPQPFPSLEEG